jgi:hypothetical protein
MDMLLDDVEVPELTDAELELLIAAMPNPKPLPALPGDDMPKPTHCGHGVYIAKGDDTAKYCTACTPDCARILGPMRRTPEVRHAERELDAAEYLALPLHDRLTAASAFYSMEL